jgi:hypothetical protein
LPRDWPAIGHAARHAPIALAIAKRRRLALASPSARAPASG